LTTKQNIQEILEGCLRSDRRCQRALVDQYSGLLYVICNRYLANVQDAQDATQETLAIIFKKLKAFDPQKGSFNSWISTIAIRFCLNVLSKKKVRKVGMQAMMHVVKTADLQSEVMSSLSKSQLLNLVEALPESYRTVFNLVVIDAHTHQEVAKMLDITEGNSRARLNRARSILKTEIISIKKNETWVNTI